MPVMLMPRQASETAKRRVPTRRIHQVARLPRGMRSTPAKALKTSSSKKNGLREAQHSGDHYYEGDAPLPQRQAFPGLTAEQGHVEHMADEESDHAAEEKRETVHDKQHVSRETEELRCGEKPHGPVV